MAGDTAGESTSEKCAISDGISVINVSVAFQDIFVQGANTAMKTNDSISGNSATGWKKFTARQWAVLIFFLNLKPGSRFKTIVSKNKKARDATEVRTIMVTAIKEQQIDIERQSIQLWFGDDMAEDIWKFRFTYRPIANMAITEQGVSIMVFIRWTTQ